MFFVEVEESRENLKKDWNALKKSFSPYKNILDMHIDCKMIDNFENVTVTFFWRENPTDIKFYVVLLNQGNTWKGKILN